MPAPLGLLITRDLFFSSKVTGTALALGLAVRMIGTLEQLRASIAENDVRLIILDLDCPGMLPADVMAALPAENPISTIAFGPHVHEEQLAAARTAGFQQVMPRSKFSATLADLLREAFATSD